MKIDHIRKVLILGAGTMGQQIGFVCAMHGFQVMLYDISDEILAKSVKNIEKLGSSWFVPLGKITSEELGEIMGRISATSDPREAAKDADIISESVPEDPEIKARVFAQFNELCPERTVFTTNTSLLMPSKFAQLTGRPEKLCALHFHDVRTTSVVDVMPHPGTDPEVTQLVYDFAVRIGQIAIMLHRENNGYVFNTMLSNLFLTALTLATRDVASIEDIDRAWMGVTLMPVGPFGIMDQVGLKTVWTITDYWANRTRDPQALKNAAFLKEYVDRGELGFKTKKGFYSYPDPAYAQPDFLTGARDKK
ncbi:MAG TPA: 3-hydroxyacyl-CoA dehydrogenase [Deltaproteobacteria bacterium]|jgi:3-hydroxybutyryl-CoA dehydrogenase|nr:3-hydroxyacyl-CoA dehydrogenase [Deltaproteobacteria bacterium]HOI06442.1 3-hydroxyacyl-CoA dehydrogenase [Deltaproteobacteria bacterium]